jgi:hypothetical protein
MTYMFQDMLSEVKSHVETTGQVSIRRFLIDFEMPVIKEIQSVFGKDIKISGCYVHFRRNLRRNLQKQKHLQTLSLKCMKFYCFVSAIVALAYVPEAEVVSYYQALLEEDLPATFEAIREHIGQGNDDDFQEFDNIRKSVDSFLQYVEKTYIGQPGRLGTWNPPRFPISLWNQHEATVAMESTTTNANEAFHAVLRKMVRPNATFWSVVDDLKNMEARVRVKRDERIVGNNMDNGNGNNGNDDNGDRPGPSRKRRSEDTVRFIRNMVMKRESYATKSEYLMRVSSMRSLD